MITTVVIQRNHVGFALIKMCWFLYFPCVVSVLEIPVPQRNKIIVETRQ